MTRYPSYMRLGRPKADIDGCRKSRPHRDSILRPLSLLIISRYTDDIPANKFRIKGFMAHDIFFNGNVKNQTAAKTDSTNMYRKVLWLREWPRRICIPLLKNYETVHAFSCFVRQINFLLCDEQYSAWATLQLWAG